jgi:hypothetical protein
MKTASGIPYWPSRDPIGEVGGMNLYGMLNNDTVNSWDYLGQLVEATYYIKAQTFVARSDKGKPLTCGKEKCSCGTNDENDTDNRDYGPLPKGTYKIYKRIKKGEKDFKGLGDAWILDPDDKPSPTEDDMWGQTGRDELSYSPVGEGPPKWAERF